MTSVRLVRLFRIARDGIGDLAGIAVVILAVLLLSVGSLFVVSWTFIHVHDWLWPNKHETPTVVCWVEQGPNGLEYVNGPPSYKPGGAVEVPCG